MKNSRPLASDGCGSGVDNKGKLGLAGITFALICLLPTVAASQGAQWQGTTGGDGLPDEADCRVCHDNLTGFPILEQTNVNKHHLLVGKEISESTAPPGVTAVAGNAYTCFFCHPLVWDADMPGYRVTLYRDCLVCHPVETVSAPPRMTGTNRHHQLGDACTVCHDRRR